MIIKQTYIKLLAMLMCAVLLSSCSNNIDKEPNNIVTQTTVPLTSIESEEVIKVTNDRIIYEEDDYYVEWKYENPNYIVLNGRSATLKGSGAKINDGVITITKGGVYVISGKLEEGQIIVEVTKEETVKLVLNGMELSSSDDVAIYVKRAGKTIISLQEGTNNIVTGADYVSFDEEFEEPDAAIFSKDSLTINGTGTLTVQANLSNGIVSKDDLKITGGVIAVKSANNGMVGRDILIIKAGTISIDAGGDGMKSTNDTNDSKGFVAIEGGVFDIQAMEDGIQAATSILITGGEFTISSGGGSKTKNPKITSAKGIKATSYIDIRGGTFDIDSSDDAIHSNNSIHITGGELIIASGDGGISADFFITIEGGKIDIMKSYEGIEANVISISGGDIQIVSSDDGINVAGGNDGSAIVGETGQNTIASRGSSQLNISGGTIIIDASGDGLDANGSIYMTGGTVIINGPTSNGNGALDYDDTFEMNGGFLVAAGSSGMAQAPSDTSTQYSIKMNYSTVQQAGTIIHLEDADGNTVMTFAPKKSYQSVVICSSMLKNSGEYTLYVGGTAAGRMVGGLYTDGEYGEGTKLVDFTISNKVTWLSETGVTERKGTGKRK